MRAIRSNSHESEPKTEVNVKAFLLLLFTTFIFAYEPKDYSHLVEMNGFSQNLIQMHLKLYAGYVKNATELGEQTRTVSPSSYEYGALKRRFGWEFDGMRLHELYFDNLGGNGLVNRSSSLIQAIRKQYGNFETWKNDFIATGTIRGIGWSLLYLDPIDGKLINTWINEHDGGHLVHGVPILIMDVFEHAYMPQFGLDKQAYIEVFFKNIDWNVVESRFSNCSN